MGPPRSYGDDLSVETKERRLELIREQLAAPLAEGEERVVETGSIPITVHIRSNRIDLHDRLSDCAERVQAALLDAA